MVNELVITFLSFWGTTQQKRIKKQFFPPNPGAPKTASVSGCFFQSHGSSSCCSGPSRNFEPRPRKRSLAFVQFIGMGPPSGKEKAKWKITSWRGKSSIHGPLSVAMIRLLEGTILYILWTIAGAYSSNTSCFEVAFQRHTSCELLQWIYSGFVFRNWEKNQENTNNWDSINNKSKFTNKERGEMVANEKKPTCRECVTFTTRICDLHLPRWKRKYADDLLKPETQHWARS